MASDRNFIYFFKNLRRKQRLSLREEHDGRETWYMHISPLELLGGFVAVVLVVFILVLSMVAYTPVLNLIPGYSGNKSREVMIQNIIRVDSIERRLAEIQAYSTDVSMIMEGKTPVVRNTAQAGDSMLVDKPGTVYPNAADSALRRQLEGSGIYGLSNTQLRRNVRSGLDLMPPVRGVITAGFSPIDGRFGVRIATAANQQVLAVEEGTVVLSTWTPDEGYVIQIQHGNNLISVYKYCSESIRPTGSRVRSSEVIGYTGENTSFEAGGMLELELWQNGNPVDPENYIVF